MRKFFIQVRAGIKQVFASITGTGKYFLPDKFYSSEFLPPEISKNIGKYTYGNIKIVNSGEGGELKTGNFCSIAGGVTVLLGGNHHTEWISTYPFPASPEFAKFAKNINNYSTSKGDVVIGNDVQLGQDALILSGVTIGDGAVVGARAVVTKNVTPYSIVAGNPAKEIRKRFDEKTITKLLKIAWWKWPEEKIRENTGSLCDSNVAAFIRKHAK